MIIILTNNIVVLFYYIGIFYTTTAGQHIQWSKLVPALIAKGVRPRTTTVKSARGAWERRSFAGTSWSDATKRTPHFKCKFCGEWKLGHICKAAVNDTKDSKANRMSTLRAIRDKLQKECDELESELAVEEAQSTASHILGLDRCSR